MCVDKQRAGRAKIEYSIKYNVTTLTSWFAHAQSRKAISSSRPKTSLPVMGSLAIEGSSGPFFPLASQ
jgi:hypothetical protein